MTTGFNKYIAYVKRDRGRNPLQDKIVLKIPIKHQRKSKYLAKTELCRYLYVLCKVTFLIMQYINGKKSCIRKVIETGTNMIPYISMTGHSLGYA